MPNLNAWQNLFKSKTRLNHANNRKSIDNNDFFFLCDEQLMLRKLETLIKQKDETLLKLTKENSNNFNIKFLSADFVGLRSEISTLEWKLDEKVTKKIKQLEKSKINSFKNLMIKIFTFWKKDKNKLINNKIRIITLNSEHIQNKCKKLNDHLVSQKTLCTNLITSNEWVCPQPDLINKNKINLPKM